MNDATDMRRSEPATHIINSTHVFHKSTIRIPTLEIIALLKQGGLVIPDNAGLSASFDAESNTLVVSWTTENTDRQTATVVAFPLIQPPDPDLTAPEEPDPDPLADIQNVQRMIQAQDKRRHTCGKDGDPGAVAPLDGRCEACEAEKLIPPNCPKCGNPMATSETSLNAWTCLNMGCLSLRNWDKDKSIPADPSCELQKSVPLALKRTEADKLQVRAVGRSATIDLPASANLQEIVAEVKAAIERQFAKADLEAIAAGVPPTAR